MSRIIRLSCAALLAGALAIAPTSVFAFDETAGDEAASWSADYELPASLDEGWTFHAAISDGYGFARGMISLFVPADRSEDAWIEFRQSKDENWPNDDERAASHLEAFIENDVRFRLLGELVTHLGANDEDLFDESGGICLHVWGAQTLFLVDEELVRSLPSDACYRNEELFEFAILLTDAALAEFPICRDLPSTRDLAIERLSECALMLASYPQSIREDED